MTPTEELCAKLDELSVEYDTYELPNGEHGVSWIDCNDIEWEAVQRGKNFEIHALQLVTPEQAIAATVEPQITENTSDGWHSFKDLYHHRALLFSVIVHNYKGMCWKSKRHDDGTELDWNFIVGIDTPWGQASYHYGMEYWDMFDCKVLERAPKYDGYTPEQSVERIARIVELDTATVGNRTDLARRLREVTSLHAFAELFGFDWSDGSDWTWHDVVCAMADAVDAAMVGTVPETKYLMALDEARKAQRKLEMCQTSQKVYQSKCRSLKETNADLRRIIEEMKAATAGKDIELGYALGITEGS